MISDSLTQPRKLARLEEQIEALRNSVPDTSTAVTLLQLQQQQQVQNDVSMSPSSSFNQGRQQFGDMESPVSMHSGPHIPVMQQAHFIPNSIQSPASGNSYFAAAPTLKRKRGDFELNVEPTADVVSKGLISFADAFLYFGTFFQGCVS